MIREHDGRKVCRGIIYPMSNMSKSFYNKKETNKDKQLVISKGITIDQSVQQITTQVDAEFLKPKYNPQTRKTHYDDSTAHKSAKTNAFSNGAIVSDPYTGSELVLTIKEAKARFGDKWQEHLAEADHIVPLNQIVKSNHNNPWVTADDLKTIGNHPDNFQTISRRMNQTGGKGGSTQQEWSRDYNRMQKIADETGESLEEISRKVYQTGENAAKKNNAKIKKASVSNIAKTSREAGENVSIYAGETAATISGIYNIVACISGEKSMSEALVDVGKDACKASIHGYAYGAGVTAINHTLTSSDSKFLMALGKSNVAGKLINTVSITGKTVVKWGSGEISTGECLIELGDKGCSYGGAYYGAMIGQALIPVPIIGGAIGSLIGGALTSELYNEVIQGIMDAVEEEKRRQQQIYEALLQYYAEQQRRKEVQQLIKTNTEKAVLNSVWTIMQSDIFRSLFNEVNEYYRHKSESKRRIAECVLITLQLKAYHKRLIEYSNNYFSEYEHCFSSIIEFMDESLRNHDYSSAMVGTNNITQAFGKEPLVENVEDFKNKIFGNSSISL